MTFGTVLTVSFASSVLFAEFLMSSDHWHSVLTAFIVALFGYLAVRLEKVRKQGNETAKAINGRMEEMVALARAEAHAEGYAEGVRATAKGVVRAPNVGVEARDLAQVVADTVKPPPLSPDPRKPGSSKPSITGPKGDKGDKGDTGDKGESGT